MTGDHRPLEVGKSYRVAVSWTVEPKSFPQYGHQILTVLEYGGGPWYKVSYLDTELKERRDRTVWFNVDKATYISEPLPADAKPDRQSWHPIL